MRSVRIQFLQGERTQELITKVLALKKVKHEEVLYTECNEQIPVRNIISFNGVPFETAF